MQMVGGKCDLQALSLTTKSNDPTLQTNRTAPMKFSTHFAIPASFFALISSGDATLLAHWTFDETSGTTAADSSGNALTATLAGAAGTWVPGQAGNGYELGGTTSRFELADSSSLQVTGSVSVSAWIKPFATSNFGVIAGIDQTGGTANDMYSLKTDGGNNLNWQVIGPGTDVNLTGGNLATLINSGADWVHVAGVYDPVSGFAGLYVNGGEVDSTTVVPTSIQSVTTPFQIGHNAADSGSFPFNGAVDDVRVYDEALSVGEIGALAAIPEPSAVALLLLGALPLLRRRR